MALILLCCIYCCVVYMCRHRLSDESGNEMAASSSSISSSLTLVTAIDEDTEEDALTPVNTLAKSGLVTADTDPVSLLPTVISEMFPQPPPQPSSVHEVPSTDSFMEDGVTADADDYAHGASSLRVLQNSESSAGSSEGAAELSEILDSAQRSDDLNANSQP